MLLGGPRCRRSERNSVGDVRLLLGRGGSAGLLEWRDAHRTTFEGDRPGGRLIRWRLPRRLPCSRRVLTLLGCAPRPLVPRPVILIAQGNTEDGARPCTTEAATSRAFS